jgi:hypothetical protein
VSLTRATLRFAEFGFLGFAVNTCMTMPFRCGLLSRRGALDKAVLGGCLRRIAWLSVRSDGAEEWKAGFDVEHGWLNAGNATARERRECVRDGVGRAMRLRMESMIACVELDYCYGHGRAAPELAGLFTRRGLFARGHEQTFITFRREICFYSILFLIYHHATQQQKAYLG